jgi:hypothetical protein
VGALWSSSQIIIFLKLTFRTILCKFPETRHRPALNDGAQTGAGEEEIG